MKFKGVKESILKESVNTTTKMTFIYVMPLHENENGIIETNGYVDKLFLYSKCIRLFFS